MRIATTYGQHPPISCEGCSLGKHTIYRSTMEADLQSVYERRREIRTISAGRTFLREGDVPKEILVLYSGWAIGFKQARDGRRQILFFLLPGDLAALEATCFTELPLPFSLKALTNLACCIFATNDMVTLLQTSNEQRREFARMRQRYMASQFARLFDLGQRTARGRLAQLLLNIHRRLTNRGMVAEDGSFAFPPKQEHLADALGLTTVYVNRTIAQLRRAGILSTERGSMTIHDIVELNRIAVEE